MSEEQEVRTSSSRALKDDSSIKLDNAIEGGSESFMQEDSSQAEKVIIIPEILSMILSLADFRTLRIASLVSRSWQREARLYMRKRGIAQVGCMRIQKFLDTLQSRLQNLPQPFRSVQVLGLYSLSQDFSQMLVRQLSSFSPPLLMITKVSSGGFPLNLLRPLLLQSSPNLETLELFSSNFEGDEFLPPMDPMKRVVFPKLRHMSVSTHGGTSERSKFPSFAAWIVGASPELETFKSVGEAPGREIDRLGSELLMKVNIQNVRSLLLYNCAASPEVLEHVGSIPFCRLEELKMRLTPTNVTWVHHQVLLDTLANCTATLRVLDLYNVRAYDYEFLAEFPVCPALQELYFSRFLGSTNVLADRFPSLQVLNVSQFLDIDVFGTLWRDLSPCFGLKTLRAPNLSFRRGFNTFQSEEEPLKFFEKFPDLETVQLNASFLLQCCGLKATGDPRFSNMLEGVKHLEFRKSDFQSRPGFACDPSSLPVLKGIQTVTMASAIDITTFPFRFSDMPTLKVFRFPWEMGSYSPIIDKLLEMARSVERVEITNCCSDFETPAPRTKSSLEQFLDSSPNARCGCSEWEKRTPM